MLYTAQENLSNLIAHVVEDAKEVARAEVALVKVQATAKLTVYRSAAVSFAIAAALALLGAIGLVVGLIQTIAQYLGAGWATLIVVGTIMVLAGLFAWLGVRRLGQS